MTSTSSNTAKRPNITRSRKGCHNCKRLKIKCDENKPKCSYCVKTDTDCDYSMKLTWGGRPYKDATKRKNDGFIGKTISFDNDHKPVLKKKKTSTVQFINLNRTPVMAQNSNDINDTNNSKTGITSETANQALKSNSPGALKPDDSSFRNFFVPVTPADLAQTVLNSALINQRNDPKLLNFQIKSESSGPELSQSPSFPSLLAGVHDSDLDKISSPPSFTTPNGISILSPFNGAQHGDPVPQNFSLDNNKSNHPHPHSQDHDHDQSQQDNSIHQPQKYHNQPNHSDHNRQSYNTHVDTNQHRPQDNDLASGKNNFALLSASVPDLSVGIESLSNALDRVADGGHQFSVQNSELFNKFIASNTEDRRSPLLPAAGEVDYLSQSFPLDNTTSPDKSTMFSPINQMNDEFLNNYSTDLAKVDASFPKPKPNLVPDFVTSNPLFSSLLNGYNHSKALRRIKLIDEDEENEDEQDPFDESLALDLDSSPGSSISRHIHYNLETIEPPLLPLPEILIQVPYYRQLMHFWVDVAADNLVAAPSHIYKDNPFKVLLPQMAMEYPAILTTILAFAATSMALITGKQVSEEIVSQLIARSCNVLLKMLKDKDEATSDGTLATVLLLSCYELLNTNNFERHRAHTLGARQIIMARKLKLPMNEEENLDGSPDSSSLTKSSSGELESNIAYFLMRWFVYVDVIGALSATKNSQFYLLNQIDGEEYSAVESIDPQTRMDSFGNISDPKRDIDYLLGFDIKFLPELTDIVVLIRKVNNYLALPGTDSSVLPIEIITKALEVRANITEAFERGEARRQARIEKINNVFQDDISSETSRSKTTTKKYENLIEQDNILRCTNKFFCDMGLLNLYRRVLRTPRESPVVQRLANGIGRILENNITSCSSAEICSIFCLFCAACETLDEHMRDLFRARFTALTEMGNVSAVKSLQIMNRCWDTGEDWIEASQFLNIDITLL